MKRSSVVIGAGAGDEGKGLMVDYLTSPDETTLVVRFNGGAQAGHTVQLPNGHRHIFHHFGSGTYQGASTLLSEFFVHNPYVFQDELCDLPKTIVYADPYGVLTTPFDMMINQMVEENRGSARHGSCGLGINETIQRTENSPFDLRIRSIGDERWLIKFLEEIRADWVPVRLENLGIEISPEWQKRIANNDVIFDYVDRLQAMKQAIILRDTRSVIRAQDHVIFEGAQGLLLDQNHEFFPHVTHSNTGLKNVVQIASDNGIDHLDIHYMTRAYATRHGAGPFPTEIAGLSYPDPTNVPNMWQGSLRFGHLDLDLLGDTIFNDLEHRPSSISAKVGITMTCLDQIGETVTYIGNQKPHQSDLETFVSAVTDYSGYEVAHTSYGPCRANVEAL